MSILSDLLRAVLDDSEDDGVRLAYADRLEEEGQAKRAEFIRLQIAIEAAKADCYCGSCVKRRGGGQHHNGPCGADQLRVNVGGRFVQARMRERELLASDMPLPSPWPDSLFREISFRGADGLDHPVRRPLFDTAHRRGFVHSLTCTAADFLAHADAVFAAQPVREVTLTTWPDFEGDGWGVSGEHQRLRLKGRSDYHRLSAYLAFTAVCEKLLAAEFPGVKFTLPVYGPSPLRGAYAAFRRL